MHLRCIEFLPASWRSRIRELAAQISGLLPICFLASGRMPASLEPFPAILPPSPDPEFYQNIIEYILHYHNGGDKMTLVEIPFLINVAVAIGISILAIFFLYFTVIVAPKMMDLGEKEESAVYGRSTKPIHGSYWQSYPSFDRTFHGDK